MKDLTWEKTTTYNAGIDFSALNGRFSVNLDGYYRKTTDLLATVMVPAMTSLGNQMLKNIGSLKNYGLEANFDVRPIVTKDFTWELTYNVGWNHNEITELDAGSQDWVWADGTASRGNNTQLKRNKVGEPVGSFFVYQQVYDKDGKPIEGLYVDRNGDGQINDDDRYYYKDPAPKVIMGLTTKFIWRNWDFSAAFHASIGNYVYYNFLASHATISASGLYSNSSFSNTTPEAVALGFTGTTAAKDADDAIVKDNGAGISTRDVIAKAGDDRALFYMGTGGGIRSLSPGRQITGLLNGASIVKWKTCAQTILTHTTVLTLIQTFLCFALELYTLRVLRQSGDSDKTTLLLPTYRRCSSGQTARCFQLLLMSRPLLTNGRASAILKAVAVATLCALASSQGLAIFGTSRADKLAVLALTATTTFILFRQQTWQATRT